VYAFAAALFNAYGHVSQGEANAALTPAAMRCFGSRDPEAMASIARALGVWRDGDAPAEAPHRAAAEIERLFSAAGMAARLSQLGVPRDGLDIVLESSLKNFNADPKREFVRERDALRAALEAAW
jgi:alcohol dehydrogenase class IV